MTENNKMSQNCKGKNKHMPSLRLVQMLEKSDTCFKTYFKFYWYLCKEKYIEMHNKNEKLSTEIGILQRAKCEF